jgi:hypothetical protein
MHPDVVRLDEPVGGYTYWMGMTPYPNGNDLHENPSVLASNDGITWVVPAGLTNPLDPIDGDDPLVTQVNYNSDADLVHVDGTLYLFWRRYTDSQGVIYLRTSTDGVDWTPRQVVLDGRVTTEGIVSPAVMHDPDTGLWHLWYGHSYNPITLRHRTANSPAGPWSAPESCPVAGIQPGRDLWHYEVTKRDGIYYGLFMGVKLSSTNQWTLLHLAVSEDGINWRLGRSILGPGGSTNPGIPNTAWDGGIVYRGSMLIEDVIRIWYSGHSTSNVWRTGYTEIPLSALPQLSS